MPCVKADSISLSTAFANDVLDKGLDGSGQSIPTLVDVVLDHIGMDLTQISGGSTAPVLRWSLALDETRQRAVTPMRSDPVELATDATKGSVVLPLGFRCQIPSGAALYLHAKLDQGTAALASRLSYHVVTAGNP